MHFVLTDATGRHRDVGDHTLTRQRGGEDLRRGDGLGRQGNQCGSKPDDDDADQRFDEHVAFQRRRTVVSQHPLRNAAHARSGS